MPLAKALVWNPNEIHNAAFDFDSAVEFNVAPAAVSWNQKVPGSLAWDV
jgi:hypothetical protein